MTYSIVSRAGRHVLPSLVLLAAACGGDQTEQVTEDPTVVLSAADVATAELTTLRAGVAITGTLDPHRRVDVKAQVPGMVGGVLVERGDAVAANQTLARIEAEGIRSQAASAAANVAAAEARLAQAQREMASARTLYQAGAMSEIDFQAVQTAYEAALAQLENARAQATGATEQAGRTVVRSPLTGEVSARLVDAGEAVDPGHTLFTVVDATSLELRGQVPVAQATRVRTGQPVEFTVEGYPEQVLRGAVSRISPVADPGTRQVGVTMLLPNEGRSLIPGLFATGRILTGGEQPVVVVPQDAVRGREVDAFVLVVEEGVLRRRRVSVGQRDEVGGLVEIVSGLEAGERVVVSPGEATDGTPVRMAPAGGAASSGSLGDSDDGATEPGAAGTGRA